MRTYETAEEALESPEYNEALTELLFQLADDDFLLAYRGSEWLGLAPHIEEDVAFSSINQDMMGHATLYYKRLEELGEGKADDLSHLRSPEKFRNAVLLELPNGTGNYLEKPNYDWAFAVVRNYFYTLAKKIKLESLKTSSYVPLQHTARKVLMEVNYHLMHWETWFNQLIQSTEEAHKRMKNAIDQVWEEFMGVLSTGDKGDVMARSGIIEDEETIKKRWISKVESVFTQSGLHLKEKPQMKSGNGRNGEHTPTLESALDTLSEVYRKAPAQGW
ncbi:1,2-phenylacetyl-CoA epoxidase subunit PaaC [Pseudalkalibacillus caeni]|uniref:Phenylacetate-CoA oxygenase subunit PaaI n=1 Tax=Exobacillus caeni TaxID=2574798 RepID=A0A5R9FEU2_9BACL|nr:1,2-phenylacetyl-CoA epoxidase subunit PaaC [Pseudalkalibacillus caeni]TLS38095.1 phenylacetate-CoA oxygenase subunit PaaI [Pseudalkalibacillus caeni]